MRPDFRMWTPDGPEPQWYSEEIQGEVVTYWEVPDMNLEDQAQDVLNRFFEVWDEETEELGYRLLPMEVDSR